MSIFFVLFLSLVVTNGSLLDVPKDLQVFKKKTEVVVNKTPETKPTVQVIKPEPVKEEIKPELVKEVIKPELVKEEIKPELVKEEIKPELVKEEIKPKPVKEEIKPEPVKSVTQEPDTQKDSETSYFRLILYIIGGILVAFTGLYFFSSRRSSQSAISKVDADRKDIEENITPETQEEQPVEEQPVEEPPQPETQEEPPQPETQEEPPQPETQEEPSVDEDGNNNKK